MIRRRDDTHTKVKDVRNSFGWDPVTVHVEPPMMSHLSSLCFDWTGVVGSVILRRNSPTNSSEHS